MRRETRECLYEYLKLFKDIRDYFKKNYKIRLLGEDVVHGENGFYLTMFDKKLHMVMDTIKISDGRLCGVGMKM